MKSFILSAILMVIVCVSVMGIFENNRLTASFKTLPTWVGIVFIILLFLGFLLSLYWGITGVIKGQRLLNIMGIVISLVGLGIYTVGYLMEAGQGRESAGQFDHSFNKIEARQQTVLYEFLKQTNTKPGDAQLVAYWKMYKNPGGFVLCVQGGNIIGLQVKNKTVTDLSVVSKLNYLNWLVLENCGLKNIELLNLPALQRLAVNNNQLVSLAGIENSPQLSWLNFRNNPVLDSSALKQLHNPDLYIVNE